MPLRKDSVVGVFEMIVLIVLISTIGKVVSDRRPKLPPQDGGARIGPGEADNIIQALDELNSRVGRLEEERDFYKELLESPDAKRRLRDPDAQG